MIKADFHMHTSFSSDSETMPEKMVEEAIRMGLKTICFTDHQDFDFPGEETLFLFDTDTYFRKMKKLREMYQDKIDIRIGVEIGLQPHLGNAYKEYVSSYPFDFVIGSVHVVNRMDPYYGEFFEDKTDAEAYRQAFLETLTDIRAIKDFDVLGHIDYIVRYGKEKEKYYSYTKFSDEIDEILKYLIAHGKGIELNTAGFKYGLGFCHPHPDILKRYCELGGEIITIGLSVLLSLLFSALHAQRTKCLRITKKALDIGVYDYGKVKKSPYKVYYGKQAEDKFTEVLMKSERLMNSGKFGQYRTPDDFVTDDVVAYEYCPELNYVMTTGGHGYAFAYDLETLEEIFVNPSTFVYSPSGCYRFGTFDVEAGTEIYLEVKQGDKWVSHLRGVCPTMIEGVYWFDDQTIHYLKKKESPSGTSYWIGYSMKFSFENEPEESIRP